MPLLLAGAITAFAWPIPSTPATTTLDASWQIGLHVAAAAGLRHGVEVVFTYGPLGFLTLPWPIVGVTSAFALVATAAIYLALVLTLLVEARRILPLWAAALVTLVAARMFAAVPPPEAFLVTLFAWALEAIARRLNLRVPVLIAVAGLLTAIAALNKLDVGITALLMGAAVASTMTTPWWRGLAGYGLASAAASVALWLVAGQRLTDAPAFLSGAFEIVSGFSDAMAIHYAPSVLWAYLAIPVLVGLLSWVVWRTTLDWPLRNRVAAVVVWAVFAFATWKTGIVREHPYALPMLALALFPLSAAGEWPAQRTVERQTWLVAFVALWIASAAGTTIRPGTYADIGGSARAFAREFGDALPWRIAASAERTSSQLRAGYNVPVQLLSEVAGRRVAVDPWEASVAYAYPQFSWTPLPVFQTYQAYTPYLDELNAARLRAPDGPDRILRHAIRWTVLPEYLRVQRGKLVSPGEQVPRVVDGRFRWFESPWATVETFCRYAEVTTSGDWQVLARTGRSCGPPEPLATLDAKAGEAVRVPAESRPGRLVVVRIRHVEPTPVDRLVASLYKGSPWYVILGDGVRYRLVRATAADGLLIAVPPEADGSGPFAFGGPYRTISVQPGLSGPSERSGAASITYEFLSLPLTS